MKTIKNIISLILLITIFTFTSCNKDDGDDLDYNLEKDYFTVTNASYVKREFPTSSLSKPVIENIVGNHSVLAGGSNAIELKSNVEVSNVLIGVKDIEGYLKLHITPSNSISFLLLMNQDLTDDNFEIKIAVVDNNGNISDISYVAVSLIQAGTGHLQISCSWNQLNDVDLHLVEPSGEDIYYGNAISTNNGKLDVDSNANCNIDQINNENITYGDDSIIQSGEYIVRTDLYSNCNIADSTNYNVVVYYEGELVTPTFGTNPYNDSFNEDDEDFGGSGDGKTILKFEIPATRSNSEKTNLIFNYNTKRKILSPQKM